MAQKREFSDDAESWPVIVGDAVDGAGKDKEKSATRSCSMQDDFALLIEDTKYIVLS